MSDRRVLGRQSQTLNRAGQIRDVCRGSVVTTNDSETEWTATIPSVRPERSQLHFLGYSTTTGQITYANEKYIDLEDSTTVRVRGVADGGVCTAIFQVTERWP